MPWSVIENVPAVVNEVNRLQPGRMVELGIGFGKYGTLCREALDGMYGRCRADQWLARIDGIEAWAEYRNPAWGTYSSVKIADFSLMDVSGYDLVLMVDSLEHLPQGQSEAFLHRLVERNKRVLISVPNGACPQPEAVHGNEFEIHRATFLPGSFDRWKAKILHLGYCIVASIPGNG